MFAQLFGRLPNGVKIIAVDRQAHCLDSECRFPVRAHISEFHRRPRAEGLQVGCGRSLRGLVVHHLSLAAHTRSARNFTLKQCSLVVLQLTMTASKHDDEKDAGDDG